MTAIKHIFNAANILIASRSFTPVRLVAKVKLLNPNICVHFDSKLNDSKNDIDTDLHYTRLTKGVSN